jgi:PAS domain S-box-containing protein
MTLQSEDWMTRFFEIQIEVAGPMEIIKFRSQLEAVLEPVRVYLRVAQHRVTRLGASVVDRSRALQKALRARENDLRKVLASSLAAIDVAKSKIIKFRSRLVAALGPLRLYLRRVQHRVTRLGASVVDGSRALQKALRARENDLRKVLASSLAAIDVAKTKIIKFRSQLVAALEPVRLYLRRVQHTVTRLGRSVVDRPRALQKALRARENDLRKLLVSSLDAIVITDVGGRLVTANSKALDLFGVSETNVKKFTINVFLSHSQIPYFGGHSSAFIRREERHGECKVRRLDGSSRVAEYLFVPHFLPNRHVCRFRNVKTAHVKCVATFNPGQGSDSKPASGVWSPAVEDLKKQALTR